MKTPSLLQTQPDLTKRFVLAIHEGRTLEQAAVLLGVHRATVWKWRKLGREVNERGKRLKPIEPYRSFARAIDEALETYEAALMDEIARQGHDARDAKGNVLVDVEGRIVRKGDFRALEWILERRFPKRYAPQIKILVEEQLQAALAALERGLEPEVFARVLSILARADQTDDADDLGPGPAAPGGAPAEGGTTH